jgi:peptidoglycan/LPS O-acetylase OafA/YrhL
MGVPLDEAARPSATGKSRISALDGVRAVSLLLIMGYHFGVGWLQGGFFSLDIFYVLSGYLITGLLLGEFARRGRIQLSSFWLRRARRLLPALIIVLVAVTVMVRFAEPAGLYPGFRMNALSALFYFSNWWQIHTSSNYFVATGTPSPLTHTWSLAVEEQFYLVWPLVVFAVLSLTKTFQRGVQAVLVLAGAGAIASALEMAYLYNPRGNITRLYFGTDTHAQSILIGATMACALTLIQRKRGEEGMAPVARSTPARYGLVAVGLLGFAGTFALTYFQGGTAAFDYQGGFFLSGLSAAAIVIGAVCVPAGPIARVLSLKPLVWLGLVSYGAYLWHYPVFIYLDQTRTGTSGFPLLVIRFGVTFAIAAASYYLVERPVIYGTFWRSLRAIGPAAALMVATVAVVVIGTVVPATAAVRVNRFRPDASNRTPINVVLLGDSVAVTLGTALVATAPAGVKVHPRGIFGCGLALGANASNKPPQLQLAMFPACNEATPARGQWPAHDTASVRGTKPGDVVVFIAGDWEVQDILQHGHWDNITQPSFQRYELQQMRKVVKIGTAHGAHFDFTTMPAMAAGAAFGEPPFPEDSSKRRLIYDHLIKEVAGEFPGKVSIVDLGSILSPKGVFTLRLDGVQVRTADGVHTPSYAPGNPFAGNSSEPVAHAFYDWLSPRIWPLIIATSRSG